MTRITVKNLKKKAKKTCEKQGKNTGEMGPRWVKHPGENKQARRGAPCQRCSL
jgi:hypothetical protein